MRLINTSTRKVEEFWRNVPKYAILSHTWDEKEITLQEMQQLAPEKLPGYEKIDRCCKVVAKEGFEYVWIDTCCIDKHSSSELSEAINSMYQWYKEAQVCITYLSDVLSADNPSRLLSSFKTCKWFKRGWTLQELIAPSMVEFYGRNKEGDWTEIGTKLSLQRAIFEATGIPIEVLKTGDVRDISVAKRMSWASRRETTREEDRAYSLMGLFDINMPMVYGEGKRAFVRLQEEIMKISNEFVDLPIQLTSPTELSQLPLWLVSPGNCQESPTDLFLAIPFSPGRLQKTLFGIGLIRVFWQTPRLILPNPIILSVFRLLVVEHTR